MGNDKNDLEEIEEVELDAVTITGPDGSEQDFAIVATFFLGTCDYVALCPIVDGAYLDEENLSFYRCEGDDENLELEEIDSEEEMRMVLETYEELCSEDDF